MHFIDRANIYFKGGIGMNIIFSDIEKTFIARMENTDTFEEVEALAEEIYNYAWQNERRINSSLEMDEEFIHGSL